MYSPVIFDLDGTLLNTLDDLAAAGNHALKALGFPVHETLEYKLFVGNGIPKLIERMCPSGTTPETLDRAHLIFSAYYAQHKADLTRPYEGMTELLRLLEREGITAVCNTNKDHVFSKELLGGFFGSSLKEIVGAGLGYPVKPDPSAARYLAEKYRVSDAKPLYVGDSSVDMQTAKSAGITACGVLWGFRSRGELERCEPEYIVNTVNELRELIIAD